MHLNLRVKLLLLNILLIGCQAKQTDEDRLSHFKTVPYVEVGKKMEHVQTPYIIDLSNRSKRLVFIGCNHIRDSTDRQFVLIEQSFNQLKPQVAFNEGGQIDKHVHYPSLRKAAFEAGETGCLKYLSDQANIQLLNGDTPDSLEFSLTTKRYPKEEMYLYYIMERIVIPYLNTGGQKEPFEPYFNVRVNKWFVKNHFPLKPHEQTLAYFKELYQQHIKRPFALSLNEDVEKFDYINGGSCHFCQVGRQSKMIRDSILLAKIDQALDHYDRVIVTFGHGHALAIEPALTQLIHKNRR